MSNTTTFSPPLPQIIIIILITLTAVFQPDTLSTRPSSNPAALIPLDNPTTLLNIPHTQPDHPFPNTEHPNNNPPLFLKNILRPLDPAAGHLGGVQKPLLPGRDLDKRAKVEHILHLALQYGAGNNRTFPSRGPKRHPWPFRNTLPSAPLCAGAILLLRSPHNVPSVDPRPQEPAVRIIPIATLLLLFLLLCLPTHASREARAGNLLAISSFFSILLIAWSASSGAGPHGWGGAGGRDRQSGRTGKAGPTGGEAPEGGDGAWGGAGGRGRRTGDGRQGRTAGTSADGWYGQKRWRLEESKL